MLWHEPRSAPRLLRAALLRIWRARGGGFYGLGYVVTFVVMEVRLVAGEFQGSDSMLSFLSDQLLEYLFRLGVMSFVNVLLAFLWPLFVLEHLQGWGVPVLLVGYFVFERWLRPRLEATFPELNHAEGRESPTGAPEPSGQEGRQREGGGSTD